MFDELKLSVAVAHIRLCRAVKRSASDGGGGSASGECGRGEPRPSSSSLIKPQLRSHRLASGYTGNVAVESAASLTLALQNVTAAEMDAGNR